MSSMDPRIPVLLAGSDRQIPPQSGILIIGHGDVPGAIAVARVSQGPAGFAACACCTARGRVAQALGGLYLARARGEVGFFRQIVVMTADLEPEVRAAVEEDVFVAARYRMAPLVE